MQHTNSSYKLHNVSIQNYPVQQDVVNVSVYTQTHKVCNKQTCYKQIIKQQETIKFNNVPHPIATLIAYDRKVSIIIDEEIIEQATYLGYDEESESLSLTLDQVT